MRPISKTIVNMYLLISYDISNNALRLKLSKRLVYYGLDRIQYSVFVGKIKNRLFKALKKEIQELIQKSQPSDDKILILPIEKQLLERVWLVGKDDKIISDILLQKNTLIL